MRLLWQRAQRGQADDGFSLMEAVIAAMVLAMTAAIVAGLLVQTLGVARNNTARTTAADLASSRIEQLRAMRALDIPDGTIAAQSVVVGGTTYSIVQNAAYASLGSDGSVCTSGGQLAFKRITVTVTWDNMGSVAPVRTDTLRNLGFGTDGLDATKGAVAVLVQGSDGNPVAGIAVTVRSSTGSTVIGTQISGSDGCVVFTNMAPGNYVAAMNTSGYVDVDGNQAETSAPFGVAASQLSTPIVQYDRPGALAVTFQAPSGYTVPAGVNYDLVLTTSLWSSPTTRAFPDCSSVSTAPAQCVSGSQTVRSATQLFPAKYSAYAGSCSDAVPATTPVLNQVSRGATTAVTAQLGGVRVRSNNFALGTRIVISHASGDSLCSAGLSYEAGSLPAGASNRLQVALPYGTWTVRRVGLLGLTESSQTFTVSESNPTPQVTV